MNEKCPRCNTTFQCKVSDIKACACSSIQLTAQAQQYIAARFSSCLCPDCLTKINEQVELEQLDSSSHPPLDKP